jgi:hypothetical protein
MKHSPWDKTLKERIVYALYTPIRWAIARGWLWLDCPPEIEASLRDLRW